MDNLQGLSLSELKDYKELLEIRIDELRRHQVDDDYFPPYTDKEIKELKVHEKKANLALKSINAIIRKKLDTIISNIEVS